MKNLLFLLLVLVTGCAVPQAPPAADTTDLLDGSHFGLESRELPVKDVLALNEETKSWVKAKTAGSRHAGSRLRKLVEGLIDDGLLNLEYDQNLTHTAAETFMLRRGNCLSFSLLFVALARDAGLDVSFQMVDVPPSFSATGDIVKLNNHINVLVTRIRSDTQFHQNHVVDFNTAEYSGNYDARRVSDNYAVALYHSNVGVEEIQAGDYDEAFLYFKRGIELDPEIPGLWTNLGALYSIRGFPELALRAYQQALVLEPAYRSALINLSKVLTELGRPDEAEKYRMQARFHQRLNPYFHLQQAQIAYENSDFGATLEHLDEAIRLKGDEHLFYKLQGLTHEKLGDRESADKSYRLAEKLAQRAGVSKIYERKLNLL